jgi:hypothetical protein
VSPEQADPTRLRNRDPSASTSTRFSYATPVAARFQLKGAMSA